LFQQAILTGDKHFEISQNTYFLFLSMFMFTENQQELPRILVEKIPCFLKVKQGGIPDYHLPLKGYIYTASIILSMQLRD
jgi:hypothetical protein